VRLRLLIVTAALTAALAAPAGASAAFRSYPWPLRPFHKEHPVRANFGDPRTLFAAPLFDGGIEGPGAFSFHNGIDIVAPDGTAVYSVMSGTAKLIDNDTAVSVSTGKGRVFEYEHLVPAVHDGQNVVALKTVVGHIARSFGHVHFTELREGHVWNPLGRGGIAP
jgi:murein DD-endopeptidase MepM/ murein hydrolase activator NlpD